MKIIKKAAIIAIAGALSLSMTGCGILETGIGAAIFVPAIVGIVNNANSSQSTSDAATIDNACKNYYAEVVAGTMNASNPGQVTSDVLPAATAASSVRKSTALKCTVGGAIEYAGLTNLSSKLSDMAADYSGTIHSKNDTDESFSVYNISYNTTFAERGYS